MTTDEQPDIAPHDPGLRRRSGSENRKRRGRVMFRVSDEEYAAIEAAAEGEGMSLGGYVRSRVLAMPTTQARRRAPGDIIALARLQAELNRIGGNIYQLVRHVNSGCLVDPFHEIRNAFEGYGSAIAAIMAATTRAYGDRLPGLETEPEDDGEEALA